MAVDLGACTSHRRSVSKWSGGGCMIYGFGCGVRRLVPRDEVGRVVDHGPIGGLSSAARMLPGRVRTCGLAILRRQVTFIAADPSTRPLRTTTRSQPDQPWPPAAGRRLVEAVWRLCGWVSAANTRHSREVTNNRFRVCSCSRADRGAGSSESTSARMGYLGRRHRYRARFTGSSPAGHAADVRGRPKPERWARCTIANSHTPLTDRLECRRPGHGQPTEDRGRRCSHG